MCSFKAFLSLVQMIFLPLSPTWPVIVHQLLALLRTNCAQKVRSPSAGVAPTSSIYFCLSHSDNVILHSCSFLWVSPSPKTQFQFSSAPTSPPGLACVLWPISVLSQPGVIAWCPPMIFCVLSYLSNESISSFRARNCTIFLSIHYSTEQQRGILINTVLNRAKYIEPVSYFNKFIDQAGHRRLLYSHYIILSTSCCWAQQLPLLLNISFLYLQSMDSMTQILPKCIYKNMKNYDHMSLNLWLYV